jgi:hypothetical protein
VSAGKLRATLSGTEDADLYVRSGQRPSTSRYSCRPYAEGSDETCELDGAGSFFVAVRGYAALSDVRLEVTFAP